MSADDRPALSRPVVVDRITVPTVRITRDVPRRREQMLVVERLQGGYVNIRIRGGLSMVGEWRIRPEAVKVLRDLLNRAGT